MLKNISYAFAVVLMVCLAGCSSAPKCSSSDIKNAVLDKIMNAVKNQALFQEIMLDSYVVKSSPIGTVKTGAEGKVASMDYDVISDNTDKKDFVADKFIVEYAAHPKYYFWKAKNDPDMNLILQKADKYVAELDVGLSDAKECESDNDNKESTCSADVSIGQEKMFVKYTVRYSEDGKFDIELKDNNDNVKLKSGAQTAHGSLSALCNTWENAKASTFPPANPQVIAALRNYNDNKNNKSEKLDIRFWTLIPDDLIVGGKVLNKGLRSYKVLQKQVSSK